MLTGSPWYEPADITAHASQTTPQSAAAFKNSTQVGGLGRRGRNVAAFSGGVSTAAGGTAVAAGAAAAGGGAAAAGGTAVAGRTASLTSRVGTMVEMACL